MPDSTSERPRPKSTREKPVTLAAAGVEEAPPEVKTPRQLDRRELEALRDKLRRKYH